MLPKVTKYFFLSLFLLMCISGKAQTHFPVKDWVKILSARKDLRLDKLFTIYNQLIDLDSNTLVLSVATLEKALPSDDKYAFIRFHLLKSRLIMEKVYKEKIAVPELLSALKSGLQMSYELEDPVLMAEMHQALAMQSLFINDPGMGLMHAVATKDIQEKTGHEFFREVSYARHYLGILQYKAREFPDAILTLHAALRGDIIPELKPGDTLNARHQVWTWNTLGLAYKNVGMYDSAFYAFKQGLAIAERNHYDIYVGIIEGNIGDIYFKLHQFDSAKVYLQRDVEVCMAQKEFLNASLSMQWLARISARDGHFAQALEQIREAYRVALPHAPPYDPHLAEIYLGFADIFEKAGMADSAMLYMKRYLIADDTIEGKNVDLHSEIANVRVENVAALHNLLTLNKEKKRVVLIRNMIILFILVMSGTGFLYLNRQRLKLRLQNMISEEEKNKLLRETENARVQLGTYTRHILEKTALVDNLQEQLANKALNEAQVQYLNELSRHSILTDEDWEQFKELFEKVYPAFFIDLRNSFPEITLAELRIAALVKLRVPAKDAAALLGISPNSVHKTRQRLRHRLGLEPDADLEQYFLTTK